MTPTFKSERSELLYPTLSLFLFTETALISILMNLHIKIRKTSLLYCSINRTKYRRKESYILFKSNRIDIEIKKAIRRRDTLLMVIDVIKRMSCYLRALAI